MNRKIRRTYVLLRPVKIQLCLLHSALVAVPVGSVLPFSIHRRGQCKHLVCLSVFSSRFLAVYELQTGFLSCPTELRLSCILEALER